MGMAQLEQRFCAGRRVRREGALYAETEGEWISMGIDKEKTVVPVGAIGKVGIGTK